MKEFFGLLMEHVIMMTRIVNYNFDIAMYTEAKLMLTNHKEEEENQREFFSTILTRAPN